MSTEKTAFNGAFQRGLLVYGGFYPYIELQMEVIRLYLHWVE